MSNGVETKRGGNKEIEKKEERDMNNFSEYRSSVGAVPEFSMPAIPNCAGSRLGAPVSIEAEK